MYCGLAEEELQGLNQGQIDSNFRGKGQHYSFSSPTYVWRLGIMSPSDEVHWLHCVKQRCTFLLCCLFSCQCLQSLEWDESSLSASTTRDCIETKAVGRPSKELTASTVNYPSTCRLNTQNLQCCLSMKHWWSKIKALYLLYNIKEYERVWSGVYNAAPLGCLHLYFAC